jgi:hypothetical protein
MLFWQFEGGVPLQEEIMRAKQAYLRKYGSEPQVVFVHPTVLAQAFPDGEQHVNVHGLRVKSEVTVLRNTLHMGMDKNAVNA